MIYAHGIHGRFRLGYGAQLIHAAAAMAGDRAEIDDPVTRGADPDARDAGGCTPLHYAAWNNPV
ncbi:MAG: ankyrin repeat domain-containing protein, partial [Rhodospirillales bacterium]|nr:ankyrin repeat domain-containing protein [Rhodospirillales bacterium]